MRLGICYSPYHPNFVGYGDEKFKKIKEFGFTHVDFGLGDTTKPVYTLPQEESDAILLKERTLAEEAGLTIHQVHGPWCWPPPEMDVKGMEKRLEDMKKSIRAASVLGVKYWVVHPIMPYWTEEKGTEFEPLTREANFKFMRELLVTAKEYDVTICLENMPMPDFSIATPKEILEFVEEIGDDHFQICLDTGHVGVFEGMDLAEETRRLGKHIKVLHVHDNVVGPDVHLIPYYGRIDWLEFVKALREIEYDGVFNLELLAPTGMPAELREVMYKAFADLARTMLTIKE